MNTLLLLGGAYLLLGGSGSAPSSPPQQTAAQPTVKPTGSDLAAAFGAFVGGLIQQATKD